MNKENFERGFRLLAGAFPMKVSLDMRATYFAALMTIPDEMFLDGCMRCTREWVPYRQQFPSPAEVGEFCVPGERYVVVQSGSRNVTKTVAWPMRLHALMAPKKQMIEEKVPNLTPEQRKENIRKMWELVDQIWPKHVSRTNGEQKPTGSVESTMTDEQIMARKKLLADQAERLRQSE